MTTEKKTLTDAEVLRALVGNKKLTSEFLRTNGDLYVYLGADNLKNDKGCRRGWGLLGTGQWELYEEPHQNPTLAECLAATRIEIVWPEGVIADQPDIYSQRENGWHLWVTERLSSTLLLPGAKVTILEG